MDDQGFEDDENVSKLPFSRLIPFLCGTAFGLFARAAFAGWTFLGAPLPDVMTFSFLFGTPAAVGAVTVLVAERAKRRSWSYCVFAPWGSVVLFVGGTAVALIEGLICIALAMPIFLAFGSIGGVAAGIAVRLLGRPKRGLPAFALLPFVLAGVESGVPVFDRFGEVEASVEIPAPAETVWRHINAITNIRPDEVSGAWAHRIGAPRPREGVTSVSGSGRVRVSKWEKGVEFRELITEWAPPRRLRWTYEFDADSFPPGALDDHVVIGGRYFDLLSTSYDLQPTATGTLLTIQTRYRISTGFNWYADALAQFVLRDFLETMLTAYRGRAQATAARELRSPTAAGG